MVESQSGDNINFNKIKKSIRSDVILIGYPEGLSHSSGEATLDEIAKTNSENENEKARRPFLHDGIKANIKEINLIIKQEYTKMITGKEPDYNKLGVVAMKGIQEFVRGDFYRSTKPNAAATIKAKTSKKDLKTGQYKDKPLIDTAQTINGVTYLVTKG